jgi:uncharacterized integral membrane protein
METFANDFVALLQYLLPGFVSAWIFYSFTSYPKPSQFERVVQALIFTLFVQVLVFLVQNVLVFAGGKFPIFQWNSNSNLVWSIISAIILGVVFSYYANNDRIHKKLRAIGFTRESSYASEWFGAFINNVTYVVLHLDDDRRLYGWPIEWPTEPNKGHFVLTDASWLTEDGSEIFLKAVENIMIDAQHVKIVEFLKKTWEE